MWNFVFRPKNKRKIKIQLIFGRKQKIKRKNAKGAHFLMSLIILCKSVYATQLCMKRTLKKLRTLSVSLRYYRYHMSLLVVVVKQSNVIRKEQ